MKELLIVTSGGLPLPASKGGAVETLTELLLDENEISQHFHFTVLSIYDFQAKKMSLGQKNTEYIYFRCPGFLKIISVHTIKVINKICRKRICNESLFLLWVLKHIKKKKYDAILIENRPLFVMPIVKQNAHKAKIVLHIHNAYLDNATSYATEIIDKLDMTITVSDFLRKEVLKIPGANEKKVKTLLNSVKTELFDNRGDTTFRTEFRRNNGIEENDTVYVFCGRINPNKGVKELIMAFDKVNDDHTYLLIIGATWYSSSSCSEYLEVVKKYAEHCKNHILFTGYIRHVSIAKYYSVADAAVIPSLWDEPAGLVITESLLSELPLITTNKGGIPEYANNANAVCIEVTENLVSDLALQMERLKNPALRAKMRCGAYQFASAYNEKVYFENFEKIIESIKE